MPNFLASLIDSVTGENTLTVDASCSTFTYTDESNYDTNTQVGHARASFTDYRRVVITTGDGSTYIQSSIAAADVDESIPTASTGTDTINFTLRDTDVDGIYTVRMCNYPTWDVTLAYATDDIVYYSGTLYKALSATTIGATPDVTTAEWEVYAPLPADELLTPYCTEAKVVVLCRSILDCKEKLVHESFCLIASDFCNDDVLCKNKTFLSSIKLDMLIKATNISVNRQAWNEVETQVNLMKSICGCR
jgi:hypothetical protein